MQHFEFVYLLAVAVIMLQPSKYILLALKTIKSYRVPIAGGALCNPFDYPVLGETLGTYFENQVFSLKNKESYVQNV